MIYVFENYNNSPSIVFDGHVLSDEQKKDAIEIEYLPEPEIQIGKTAILKCSKSDNKLWYEYVDSPKNEIDILNQKLADMQAVLDEMLMGGI